MSGVSPADTMVANFSNAWLHGRDVISTFTPGLAASKLFTMPLSVSVRSGLVMTSVSFRVVWATALPAKVVASAVASSRRWIMVFPLSLSCLKRVRPLRRKVRLAHLRLPDGLGEIGDERILTL